MRRLAVVCSALAGLLAVGIAAGAAAWIRERRSKTVFPANQAEALLNPLRRWIQPPARVIEQCGVSLGERVLELGAGPGYFTIEAVRAVGPRGYIVSADLQPAMLLRLRERARASGAVARLVATDATALPFGDATFDRAILVSMLGEVPDARRALEELRRVLRPGGVASFCETINDPDYVREGTLRQWCWDAGLAMVGRQRGPIGYVAHFRRVSVTAAAKVQMS
jgi:SAM-dependent methyltransferase